ncbi:glycosyltransferase [Brachybacterium sacelli]|uniref:Glycosyltransferase involved in cell wall biosynthesis n=1 Tax=Brachybacterium sacelli TaxID=173364 RepID=A0ABS4X3X1_9MICO|nr:glycosyltransferase [Brachybacterium sacelli]MBP2382913.1 glycosyltransferase involved in cell wall biosynthesis [Brachybacterium sacelli]
MRTVFLVLHSLGRAGRSAAVIEQCRMFLALGLKPVIVTFTYEPRFTSGLAARKGDFALPAGVEVRNIFHDLQQAATQDQDADWSREQDLDREGLLVSTIRIEGGERSEYFDRAGRLVKRREVKDGRTASLALFEHARPVVRREYEDSGACGRERTLDPATGATIEERYFTPDGICYVTRYLEPASGRQLGAYVHHATSGQSVRYSHNTPWHAAWLDQVLAAESPRPLVIAQHPTAMTKLLDTDPAHSSRLFLSHVNIYQEPYGPGAPLRTDYAQPFRRVEEMPVVLSLTEAQARDMRTTFGPDRCDPLVIPNVVRDRRTDTSIATVSGRVGIVCRLSATQKRVDHLLCAWPRVVAAVPRAHLEIGGHGGARQDLEELSATLGIRDSVTFLGWLDDSVDLMASCVLTVSTGRSEGFGLSIGESLAAGTPVVSYDIDYGPSDLIRDGVDGALVPDGDHEALARGIIRLLRRERRAARAGRSAAERMAREFSPEVLAARWSTAFALADTRS